MTRNDASPRAVERADDLLAEVGLEGAGLLAGEPLERDLSDTILPHLVRPIEQFAEVRELGVVRREDEFAGLAVSELAGLAALVQELAAADAEGGFERVGRVVNARVDHFAVPGRRLLSDLAVPAEE